jgi:hypothetical protein
MPSSGRENQVVVWQGNRLTVNEAQLFANIHSGDCALQHGGVLLRGLPADPRVRRGRLLIAVSGPDEGPWPPLVQHGGVRQPGKGGGAPRQERLPLKALQNVLSFCRHATLSLVFGV